LGIRGLNQKSKKTVLSWRTDGQKNGSIPSRNKKEESMFVTHRWTDEHTDRVNDKK